MQPSGQRPHTLKRVLFHRGEMPPPLPNPVFSR